MSFLEDLGITPPSQIRRAMMYPFAPQDVVESAYEAERDYTKQVARGLHGAVTTHVNADPATLALADQMSAEFRDTPRRGRRPVTGTFS